MPKKKVTQEIIIAAALKQLDYLLKDWRVIEHAREDIKSRFAKGLPLYIKQELNKVPAPGSAEDQRRDQIENDFFSGYSK